MSARVPTSEEAWILSTTVRVLIRDAYLALQEEYRRKAEYAQERDGTDRLAADYYAHRTTENAEELADAHRLAAAAQEGEAEEELRAAEIAAADAKDDAAQRQMADLIERGVPMPVSEEPYDHATDPHRWRSR